MIKNVWYGRILIENGSVTILLFCFLLSLNIVFHILGFWKSYHEYSRKKKKASERDRTDAKKHPWNRFAWYQGEESPVDGVTRFLKEFDRLNNLKTVWHGRTLEQAWGLGICCPYPYVTLFKYTLVYWHLWKDYNKMLGISGEYHKEKKNETSMK